LAYAAGIIDGEGCIAIKRTRAEHTNGSRRTPGFHALVQVRMTNREAVDFLHELLGGWTWTEKPRVRNGRPLATWQASDAAAEKALRAVLPYLRVKRGCALNALALRELQADSRLHRTKVIGTREFRNQYGTVRVVETKVLSDDYIAQCDALHARASELNHRGL